MFCAVCALCAIIRYLCSVFLRVLRCVKMCFACVLRGMNDVCVIFACYD